MTPNDLSFDSYHSLHQEAVGKSFERLGFQYERVLSSALVEFLHHANPRLRSDVPTESNLFQVLMSEVDLIRGLSDQEKENVRLQSIKITRDAKLQAMDICQAIMANKDFGRNLDIVYAPGAFLHHDQYEVYNIFDIPPQDHDRAAGGLLNLDLALLARGRTKNTLMVLEISYNTLRLNDIAPDYDRLLVQETLGQAGSADRFFNQIFKNEGKNLSEEFFIRALARQGRQKKNKIVNKVFQACSYAENLGSRMFENDPDKKPIDMIAASITPNGVYGLRDRISREKPIPDLMGKAQHVYHSMREAKKNASGIDNAARLQLDHCSQNNIIPEVGSIIHQYKRVECTPLEDNPDMSIARLSSTIDLTDELVNIREADASGKTLQDKHADEIMKIMMEDYDFRMLNLIGAPGVGKTTAKKNVLSKLLKDGKRGIMFFYFSPRLILNSDVQSDLREICENADHPSVSIETNHDLIKNTTNERKDADKVSTIVGSGNAEGLRGLQETPYLILDPEERVDTEFNIQSGTVYDRQDRKNFKARDIKSPAVIGTLSGAAGDFVKKNPGYGAIAICASLQSYVSSTGGRNSLSKLKKLLMDRGVMGETSEIIFMLDEITGSEGGPEFYRALKKAIKEAKRDLENFPKVTLVACDASASSHDLMQDILNDPNGRSSAFSIEESDERSDPLSLKRFNGKYDTISINLDGFSTPSVKIKNVAHVIEHEKNSDDARPAVARQEIETVIQIGRELLDRNKDRTSIIFIQNKNSIAEVFHALCEEMGYENSSEFSGSCTRNWEIVTLTSNTHSQFRNLMVAPENAEKKDRIRLILMTSSGSRGISFPNCTNITVFAPEFNHAGEYAEVVQAVFRGRGKLEAPELTPVTDRTIELHYFIKNFGMDKKMTMPKRVGARVQNGLSYLARNAWLAGSIITRMCGAVRVRGDDKDKFVRIIPVGKASISDRLSTFNSLASTLRNQLKANEYDLRTDHRVNYEELVDTISDLLRTPVLTSKDVISTLNLLENFSSVASAKSNINSITSEDHLAALKSHLSGRLDAPLRWSYRGGLIFIKGRAKLAYEMSSKDRTSTIDKLTRDLGRVLRDLKNQQANRDLAKSIKEFLNFVYSINASDETSIQGGNSQEHIFIIPVNHKRASEDADSWYELLASAAPHLLGESVISPVVFENRKIDDPIYLKDQFPFVVVPVTNRFEEQSRNMFDNGILSAPPETVMPLFMVSK